MNPSNRILQRQGKLQHYTNSNLAKQKHSFRFSLGERSCLIHFDLDAQTLGNLKFSGDLGEWEVIFDLYMDLMQGQELENAKKIGVKELDHYLRNFPSKAIFEFYPDEIFHIIRLPWAIDDHLKSTEKQKQFYSKQHHGEFLKLPLGMQFELMEDFISDFIKFPCQLVDIQGDLLILQLPDDCDRTALLATLNFHFQTQFRL